jgi:exodeoxyribonuclease V alpha subunit
MCLSVWVFVLYGVVFLAKSAVKTKEGCVREKMDKICGKILSLPKKIKGRKSKPVGTILVTRGELAGQNIQFSAPFDKIPFLRTRMLICLYGELNREKKLLCVKDAEDITRDLDIKDIEALASLAPGLMSNCVEEAINLLGLSRIGNLVDLLLTEEKRNTTINTLADAMGDEKAFTLVKIIEDVTRDRDWLNVYKLFSSTGTSLDYQHAIIATDALYRRAQRHNISVSQLIEEYPWILAQVFDEDGLIAAEAIAKKRGIDFPVDRCRAHIMAHLFRDVRLGHSYTPLYHLYGNLMKNFNRDIVNKALNVINRDNEAALSLENKKPVNKRNGYFIPETKKYADVLQKDLELEGMSPEEAEKTSKAVLLPGVYWSELRSAKKIAKILNTPGMELDSRELKLEMIAWAGSHGIKLDDEQLQIADRLCENKIITISGQAGSGKTTVIKALIHALKKQFDQPIPILAPTGTAAQRAGAEVTGDFATIHRWAGIALGDDDLAVGTSEQNDLEDSEKAPVIIVDEMSMATITVFHRLLHVADPSTRFVLIGDPGQLPPIGPGKVFETIIALAEQPDIKQIAHIELKGNYRTRDGVTKNAILVRSGSPIDTNYPGITLIEATTQSNIIKKTVEIVKELLQQGVSWRDILVLGSTRSKGVGTEQLNLHLKKEFGSKPVDETMIFGIGDPVIAIRNDYADKNIPKGLSPARKERWIKIRMQRQDRPTIYNGTRGIVTDYLSENGQDYLEVTFMTPEGETRAKYQYNELSHYIELAYATTVHKIQGGQAKHVIFAGNTSIGRDMLYTILTRSMGNVWLIGPGEIWEQAALKEPVKVRSKFKYRILDEISRPIVLPKEKTSEIYQIDYEYLSQVFN